MTETVSSPRMRTAVYHLSRAFLENDQFSFSALSPNITRHFPYSKAFVSTLEDPRFLEYASALDTYYLEAVTSHLKLPTGLTPFSVKLVEKALSSVRISEALPSYTEKTPISARIPSFNLTYHPTVGFEAACALFAKLCQSNHFPWQLVNVCEVVPSELRCFSVRLSKQVLSGSNKSPCDVIVNFWVNKWLPQGVTEYPLPHIGVAGGGPYALWSRLVAPLGLQLDLTGVLYAKMEAGKDTNAVEEVFALNPHLMRTYYGAGDRTFASLADALNYSISQYSHRAGMFHFLGGSSAREVAMAVVGMLGLDKLGMEKAFPPAVPAGTLPSLYAATRFMFGETFRSSYTAPGMSKGLGISVYDSYRSSPGRINLVDTMWNVCKFRLTSSWMESIKLEQEADATGKTFLHWKDPEVKDFWLAKIASPRTIRELQTSARGSPEVMVEKWKALAEKMRASGESESSDKPGDLVRHSALAGLRNLVT